MLALKYYVSWKSQAFFSGNKRKYHKTNCSNIIFGATYLLISVEIIILVGLPCLSCQPRWQLNNKVLQCTKWLDKQKIVEVSNYASIIFLSPQCHACSIKKNLIIFPLQNRLHSASKPFKFNCDCVENCVVVNAHCSMNLMQTRTKTKLSTGRCT